MQKPIRSVAQLFAGIAACAGLAAVDAHAQSYPAKPIRIVVGFTAGGATDTTARIMAQKLSEHFGQTVIVDNRAGASGSIATERVATSPADGYTLLMMAASGAVQPALHSKLPYDLERDLAPVSLVAIGPYLLVVHPSVPAHDAKHLIALARSRPGKLSYSSDGVGSALHLAGELFKLMANVNIHHVPYKGGSGSVIANASGEVDMSFPSITSALPLLKGGKVRPIAVTSIKRASFMPSIPTLDESGLSGYDRPGWYGLLVPSGVPKNIIAQLGDVIGKAVNTAEMKQSLNALGLDPQTNTPEQFAAFIRKEIGQNIKLIKLIGLRPD